MNTVADKRVDELVLAIDPALGPLGVDLQDVVMVTGSWLAGASTLAAELSARMSGVRIVEPDDLRHGQAPGAVVFVCSGTAPLTPSDCGLIQLAAANTDALIAVVSKIDVHQSWREVMDRNREILAGHDSRFAGITWLGVSTRGTAPGLDELVNAVREARRIPALGERNRLRAWATRLQGMLHMPPEAGEGARADELRNQRQAAVRRTRSSKSERTLALRNRIAQGRMTLLYFARKRVASVGGELREDIVELKRRDVPGFGDRVRRRVAEVVVEVEQGTEEHLAEVSSDVTQHWVAARPSANRPVAPEVSDPSVRSRRLETRMMALFGVFFGLGAALTVSRLVAYARPSLALIGLVVGLVAGACIAVWLVAVRGLLHDRTVLDRWLGDTMGELRGYLEQWVAARVLELETRLNADLVEIDERENDKLAARVGQIDTELREAAMNTARATALRNRDLPSVHKALTKVTEQLDGIVGKADNKSMSRLREED
ncbi:hypothetical protein FZI91_07315 [Mycobacterium sp. CBMA271]|uniref:hypothetical protein n=1 Tax=unclassified Mycobacteroides TaxID=2618759 RepID=UPI0012DE0E63|nr:MULTISPECIES: hypothetical protein [unclassified Mycobacteroides]MUM19100.1 hypothetical protein [Mycobacteroides sp. CBMA 326]MUM21514.1 hypothetical protein [Mycobacteroides sp. CBMA 271]